MFLVSAQKFIKFLHPQRQLLFFKNFEQEIFQKIGLLFWHVYFIQDKEDPISIIDFYQTEIIRLKTFFQLTLSYYKFAFLNQIRAGSGQKFLAKAGSG